MKQGIVANRILLILSLAWILFSLVFAVFDLEISKAVVNFSSSTGKFVQHFGGVPGLVLTEVAFFMFASNIKLASRTLQILLLLLLTAICTVIPFFSFRTLFFSMKNLRTFFVLNRQFFILFFVILSVIMIYIFRTVLKRFSEKNRFFSIVTIQLFVYSFVLYTPILKYFSGRVRFRDLSEGFSNYSPWYIFNGPNGNKSFPSGHTVLAWMLLTLILIFIDSGKKLRSCIAAIVISWGVFVSLNRILIGAHYASDVLFSTGFTIILFLLLSKKKYDI